MSNNINDIISIVIPVYNLDKYIKRCLNSVINQTYNNLEIIIIDDGSTDNSSLVINEFCKTDKRIKYYHQTNKGPGTARNLGISKASGKWITFVDGDDYLDFQFIEKLYLQAKENNSDLSLCKFDTEVDINNHSKIETIHCNNKNEISKLMLKDMWEDKICTFMSFGKLMKTEIINKHNICFPSNINNAEDIVFSIDYWTQANSVSYINEKLYIHTSRIDSLSRKNLKLKDVTKGRKIFNQKFMDYFISNDISELIPEAKKYIRNSKMTIMVDTLRKIGIKN